jgi:hypothetical protein
MPERRVFMPRKQLRSSGDEQQDPEIQTITMREGFKVEG